MLSHALLPIVLLYLTQILLALPNQYPKEDLARQARIAAFNAQRPMHTTALLAGAAATPTARAKTRNLRIRDLRTLTGESGMWVNLEDLRRAYRGDEEVEEREERRAREAERWDALAVEI